MGVEAIASTGFVPQFDSYTYGTLTSVGITYTLKTVITTPLKNTSGATQDVVVTLTGNVQTDIPSTIPQAQLDFTHVSGTNPLNPGESGTLTSTITWAPITLTYTTNLSVFQGTGSWSYSLAGFLATVVTNTGAVIIDGTASIVTQLTEGTATYTYTVPEPSTYGMLALGLIGMGVGLYFRKRVRRG